MSYSNKSIKSSSIFSHLASWIITTSNPDIVRPFHTANRDQSRTGLLFKNAAPLEKRGVFKIREYSCCMYVGSVHARSLTGAHTCSTVMYISAERFLHSPGKDCMCKSIQSGQYCMANTNASVTGMVKFQIWGQQILYDFKVPIDAERTTEDMLSV